MSGVRPRLPPVTSFHARALARLLRGEALTHWTYLADTGCYRLSRDIFALRQDGWPIVGTRKVQQVTDCGRLVSRHFEHYRIDRARIAISAGLLDSFAAEVAKREQCGTEEAEQQAGLEL